MRPTFTIHCDGDYTFVANVENGEIRYVDDEEFEDALRNIIALISRYCKSVKSFQSITWES